MGNEKLYVTRRYRDLVNRLTVTLADFDIDLSARGINESQLVLLVCFLTVPIQLRRKPANKQKRGRSKSGGMIDSYLFDFSEAMMRSGMIEELCKCETYLVQPGPIQVAQNDALFCLGLCRLHETHLRVKILPGLAVVDDSIYPRPQLWIDRLSELLLPPQIKRQIRIQV